MKFSDIQNLSDAYSKILTEDVGLGGHAVGTNSASIEMGLQMPDNGAHRDASFDKQNSEKNVKSAVEELKSIFGELKNAQGLESWVASKLATAADRIELLHNYIIR